MQVELEVELEVQVQVQVQRTTAHDSSPDSSPPTRRLAPMSLLLRKPTHQRDGRGLHDAVHVGAGELRRTLSIAGMQRGGTDSKRRRAKFLYVPCLAQ